MYLTVALTALLALVVLLVLLTYVRRRVIARGGALLVCAERSEGELTWRVRLARYDVNALELFSLSGPGLHPLRRLERGMNGLGPVVAPSAADAPPLVDDPVVICCRDGARRFELALEGRAYTALRSWIESSPPGVRHVA